MDGAVLGGLGRVGRGRCSAMDSVEAELARGIRLLIGFPRTAAPNSDSATIVAFTIPRCIVRFDTSKIKYIIIINKRYQQLYIHYRLFMRSFQTFEHTACNIYSTASAQRADSLPSFSILSFTFMCPILYRPFHAHARPGRIEALSRRHAISNIVFR